MVMGSSQHGQSPAVSDAGHECSAVGAALLAEGAGGAVAALVDGDWSSWLGGGNDDRRLVGVAAGGGRRWLCRRRSRSVVVRLG